MRVVGAVVGVIVIGLMLAEFFVTFMLPRRVRRDPRIARGLVRLLWRPWRAVARQLSPSSADTFLGFFGPLALLSQLMTWAVGPPAAGAILCRAAQREQWRELEGDLRAWEEWAAELMETHLSYPILGWYRSQHVNQNWLAALTAMVDVAAFITAVEADGESEAAEITFAIGRHALADLSLQYRVKYGRVERVSDADF